MGKRLSSAKRIQVNTYMAECLGKPASSVQNILRSEIIVPDFQLFNSYDEDIQKELYLSVKKYGVQIPLIVRPIEGGRYELVDGVHRLNACDFAKHKTIPVVIRELTNDQANIMRIDTNIHRNGIPVSEMARACKLKYDIRKRQGAKGDTLDDMAKETGMNYKKLQRLMNLARLIDDLLKYVDDKDKVLPLGQAEDISYLNKEEQEMVKKSFEKHGKKITKSQSKALKSKTGELTEETIEEIFSHTVPVQTYEYEEVTICKSTLKDYFDDTYSAAQIRDVIVSLLKDWKDRKAESDSEE